MVVAVIPVRVMEVTVDEVVDVIPVRDRFVAAAGPVDVVVRVGVAVVGRTAGRVRGVDLERVLFDRAARGVMQVTVVNVVDVIPVLDGGVAAARAVNVIMVVVRMGHGGLLRTVRAVGVVVSTSVSLVIASLVIASSVIVARVIERAAHELGDVVVGEPVVDVLAITAAADEALRAEDLQPLGHGGEPVAGLLREVRDAMLAAEQAVEDAQSPWIAGRPKDRGGALQHVWGERLVLDARMIVVVAAVRGLVVRHFNE